MNNFNPSFSRSCFTAGGWLSFLTSLKKLCESNLSRQELKESKKLMKKRKSPDQESLIVEFCFLFLDLLEKPLFAVPKQCITKGNMTATVKQGVMSLIPKRDKDLFSIENWRPITLNIDYKLLALTYANIVYKGLHSIVHESQTGFMSGP